MSNGAIIEIRQLVKTYMAGRVPVPALRGVDLTVEPGDFVSIIGPSGSGKSTLFHIIGGLTPPTSGHVRVAGQDMVTMTDGDRTRMRRRTIGFVFQKFNLLPNLTARDNIAVARFLGGFDHKPDPQFEEILRLLGVEQRLDHKPSALSGGEQQRIAIARAVVNHPAILLADEPTGNLDSGNSNAVLEILRGLNQRTGQTILMITHNPEAASYGHRIVEMRDGRIV
ncbi:MAG TPA: ABC transporter ATP-binding protein [Bryobacteraceae bacterium]|nr:ABC transporter ATP-binding protein [Bryobacteraceae bacterium]